MFRNLQENKRHEMNNTTCVKPNIIEPRNMDKQNNKMWKVGGMDQKLLINWIWKGINCNKW